MQAPTDAVTAFDHDNLETAIAKPPCRHQPGHTCPEDNDIDSFVGNAWGGHAHEPIYQCLCGAPAQLGFCRQWPDFDRATRAHTGSLAVPSLSSLTMA